MWQRACNVTSGGGTLNPSVLAHDIVSASTKTYTIDTTKDYIVVVDKTSTCYVGAILKGVLTVLSSDVANTTVSLSGNTLTITHSSYGNFVNLIVQLE